MKQKREIKDYKDKAGNVERYICWTCDKCNGKGFTWVADASAEDLPEDQKEHDCQ